jgi:hypothetical protein
MNHNRRTVSLEPKSVGDLLTEVVRAYLHGANPSVLLKRIKEGVEKYAKEVEQGSDEQELASQLADELATMYSAWDKKETALFYCD